MRQDKRFQRDDTVVPETPIDLQLTDVDPKVSEYSTPHHEGTYFVELMNNIIDIPSKNYYLNARDWSGGKTLVSPPGAICAQSMMPTHQLMHVLGQSPLTLIYKQALQ